MICELQKDAYSNAIALAGALKDHGTAQAVLAGTRPGTVIANRKSDPTALFVIAPDDQFAWGYLIGCSPTDAVTQELRDWFFENYCPEHGIGLAFLIVDAEDGDPIVGPFLQPRDLIRDRRAYYAHCGSSEEERKTIPADYDIREINEDLFSSGIEIPPQMLEYLEGTFGSRDAFLSQGFGSAAVRNNEAVSWCLTDSVLDHRAEISAETVESHQQKGLACAAISSVLETARHRGVTQIGGHCHPSHAAAVKTALKAGFEQQNDYVLYPVYVDLAEHAQLVDILANNAAND